MNVEAGLLRLATAIHWVGVLWAALVGCVTIVVVIRMATEGVRSDDWLMLVGSSIAAALGYAVCWTATWIIRGFAQKKS